MESTPMICTEGAHSPGYIAVFICSCVLQVAVIIISYEAWFGSTGLLGTPVIDTFGDTGVHFAPETWAMAVIWTVVFLWQLSWIGHGISTMRRKTSYGFLYVGPGHLHPEIYGLISVCQFFLLVWITLWQSSYPGFSLVLISLSIITIAIATIISLRRLYIRGPALISEWETNELWYTRFTLHNGLAAYARWLTYVFLLNLGLLFHRHSSIAVDISGTVCLAMALVGTSIYFVVEVFLHDPYCRYIFSPYVIDVLYSLGTVSYNWSVEDSSSALASMLLGVSVVFLFSKIGLMVFRHIKHPIVTDEEKDFPSRQNYGTVEYENSKYEGD